MKQINAIEKKIYTLPALISAINGWKIKGLTIAFTNGCFDILHEGHIFSLSQAAKEADLMIVGLNSDASTKRLKGEERPINNQNSRTLMMASLAIVDAVVLFEEDTPHHLITSILPDVLVKGGDYTLEQIVGSQEIIANGGRVVINKIVEGFSTSSIIAKIRSLG